MEKEIADVYRAKLKETLSKLTDRQHLLFKRMYSPKNLTKDINQVVDDMDESKLDWALHQVNNT